MRVIFFIIISSFTTIVSLPTHAAETFVCNNWLTDDQYKERTNPSGVEAVTTSAVLDVENNKINKVTYVVKLFSNGNIEETAKFSLVCNIPDVEDDLLECLQDTIADWSEGTRTSTAEYANYKYLKIGAHQNKTEASLLDDLREGDISTFYFGSLKIKKTSTGTELDASEDDIQLLRCK